MARLKAAFDPTTSGFISGSILPGRLLGFVMLLTLLVAGVAQAKETPAEAAVTSYLELKPAFTVNVGEPGARVSYAKVEVTLRLDSAAEMARAAHHEPWIRDRIVSLLSGQPWSAVNSVEGRENLRREALGRIQALLEKEEGEPLVTDLLFTTFVVQR